MRVSAFHSDAILRLAGAGLRRTKSPGGAAFEPCSIALVESYGHHNASSEHPEGSLDPFRGALRPLRHARFAGRDASSAGMT
jgi:hypothetical protein